MENLPLPAATLAAVADSPHDPTSSWATVLRIFNNPGKGNSVRSKALLLALATFTLTPPAEGQTLTPVTPAQVPATVPAPADDPAAVAFPESTTSADDGWNFSLSVPIWLAGVDGDLTVNGNDFSADEDTADDVDEFLDSGLNGAFAMHFEAERNRFGLLVDTMYLSRTAEGTLEATDAEASVQGFVGELGAFYTVVAPAADKRGWGMFRVDALGGLRVSALELGIDSDAFEDEVSRTFYDPFVGARVEVGLTEWLSFKVRGDVGGFGIDAWNTSDFAYNIDTALEFHLATWFDLGLGYRWLNYDLEFGSDSNLDATLSGPVVELKFNF